MTIKAIFFDLGGVILRTSDRTPRANLAAEFDKSYEEMDKFVFESKSAALASVGKLSETEHWLEVTRRLNSPDATMPHIRDAFFAGDTIDQEIINLLRSLRKTYKTGLISNGWDGLRPWIVNHKLENAFDTMVISAEVGIAKPDAHIYEFALKQLDVQAGEAIFVDDVEKNILACQALGMNGVLFRDSTQALTEVKQLLTLFEDQTQP